MSIGHSETSFITYSDSKMRRVNLCADLKSMHCMSINFSVAAVGPQEKELGSFWMHGFNLERRIVLNGQCTSQCQFRIRIFILQDQRSPHLLPKWSKKSSCKKQKLQYSHEVDCM